MVMNNNDQVSPRKRSSEPVRRKHRLNTRNIKRTSQPTQRAPASRSLLSASLLEWHRPRPSTSSTNTEFKRVSSPAGRSNSEPKHLRAPTHGASTSGRGAEQLQRTGIAIAVGQESTMRARARVRASAPTHWDHFGSSGSGSNEGLTLRGGTQSHTHNFCFWNPLFENWCK